MLVDRNGYRLNVGIVLVNSSKRVFWGRRIGHETWQFPQGGVGIQESAEDAMFRELYEEVGLSPEDVTILGCTRHWLRYRLPQKFVRHGNSPKVIGQKQKWFLVQLVCPEQKIRLDITPTPEFDSWRWVDYWYPAKNVIYFKRQVYRQALKELDTQVYKTQHDDENYDTVVVEDIPSLFALPVHSHHVCEDNDDEQ